MFDFLNNSVMENRTRNKKTVRRLLDKYGTLDNFMQHSTMAEDLEYKLAQGDSIVDEVERERQAMNSLPKQQGSSLDDNDMMRNARANQYRNSLFQTTHDSYLFSNPLPPIGDRSILKQYANNQLSSTQSDVSVEGDTLLEDKFSTLLSNVRKHLKNAKSEDFVPHIYLDTKGIMTTGIGYNINDFNVFMNTDFTVDNRQATYQEKLEAYNHFKNLNKQNHWGKKYGADMFKNESDLRISTKTANELVNKHTLNDLKRLREGIEDFDKLPLPLQEVLMDIRYNTGNVSEANWPNLHRGIRTKNLSLIADNVNRKDVSIERNKWARDKILSIKEPW